MLGSMTHIASASAADLRPIVAAFAEVEWLLGREELVAIVARLGWSARSQRESGGTFLTGLPYPKARADCLLRDGEVLGVTVGLSERVDSEDPADRQPLRAIIQELVAATSEVLGVPPETPSRERFWEQASGGRIVLKDNGLRVALYVQSPYVANIERDETRLGVDPNRVPGVDPEPI